MGPRTHHTGSRDCGPGGQGRKLAVMGVDPGGTTGLAACHVIVQPMLADTLRAMPLRKCVEVKGYWRDQVDQLARAINAFVEIALAQGVDGNDVHVVFENYIPDPNRIGRGATNLDPVWIGAGVCGALGWEPVWQTPSEAKSFATNDRLRRWGLWETGSDHKRDAWRHVASRVNRLV